MSNENIAVVDGDAALRMALSRLLKAYSYRVGTYSGGQEFLDSLHVDVPECLILDLDMDPMDGWEVLQCLADTGNRMPTIILTASDSAQRRERCQRAGALAFLVKPVGSGQLVSTIQTALNGRLPH
jgi:FixJ family two-component response regulator